MAINPNDPVPLYFQLKTLLTEQILSGRYGPADRLPTEQELCVRYGISRNPVHRALSELAAEGVVLRRQRLGTFVNPHWLRRRANTTELRIIVPEGAWAQQIRAARSATMRLNIVTVPLPELHRTLTRAVGEGLGPDLALLDSVWVPEFAAASFLLPLEDLDARWIADVYDSDFLPPFAAANRYGGRTFAVQAEADVAGVWFRRSTVGDGAASRLRTWTDLRDVGQLATAATREPAIAIPGGRRAGETATYCLLGLLASNGAGVLDRDHVTLDSPGTVETMAFLRHLTAIGVIASEAAGYDWDQPVRMLAGRDAEVALGGSYDAGTLASLAGIEVAEVLDVFGFVPLPAGPRGRQATLAGGMAFAVFRQSEHPDLAMQLLRRLTQPDALADAARTTAQIPPRGAAVKLVAADYPLLADTAAMLPNAVLRPALPSYPRVSEQLQAMLEGVLLGRRAPQEAVAHAAELVAAITGLPQAGESR